MQRCLIDRYYDHFAILKYFYFLQNLLYYMSPPQLGKRSAKEPTVEGEKEDLEEEEEEAVTVL